MADPGYNDCKSCGGTGDDGSGFCYPCLGTGSVSTMGQAMFFKKLYDDIMDKFDDVLDKCNDILEQLSE